MKLIEAIIKPIKLDEVKFALQKIGIEVLLESAIICHGRQKGRATFYHGTEYVVNLSGESKAGNYSCRRFGWENH